MKYPTFPSHTLAGKMHGSPKDTPALCNTRSWNRWASTNSQVNEKYAAKLAIARPYYRGEDPVVIIAKSLQKSHRYRQMYWGSASYFIQLDEMIRARHGTALSGVIREYQNCCRQTDATIDEIVTSWDRLLESSACGDLLRVYQNRPASEVFIWE